LDCGWKIAIFNAKLENVTLDMLGRAKRARIDKEKTAIIEGVGRKVDTRGKGAQILPQLENTS
jgi:chaperonin GroEL